MSRLYRVVLILALTLISVSAEAQTSDELKHKYESSGESSYLVRPDIILTVTFDENGQACRMQIDPQKTSVPNQYPIEVMSWKIGREVINELAPVSKRGKVLANFSFNGGCSGVAVTLYENVEISIASTCGPNGGGVTSARIIWRRSKCWEEYQRKSPA